MKFRFIHILLSTLLLTSCIGSLFTKRNIELGKEALLNNDKSSAFTYFNKAARNNKRKGEAYYYRGVIYEERNNLDLALQDYIHAFNHSENRALSGLAVGRMLFTNGHFKEGLPYLESAYNFDSTNLTIGYYLMRTLIGNGKADKAIVLYEKYVDADENAAMNYAKALASDSLGILDYATVFYRNAIELKSSIPKLYADYAQLLLKKGNTESALDISTLGIQLHNSVSCYKIRLQIYMSQYKWHKAISETTTLYNITKNLEYIERRARLYQFIGLLNNAKNDYTFILSLEPTNPNALFHRAIVNQRLQNETLILSDLSSFLKLDEKTIPSWQISRAKEIMFSSGQKVPPPTISVTKPKLFSNKFLGYSSQKDSIKIQGTIVEHAKIASLTINGIEIQTETFGERLKLFKHTLQYPKNDTIKVAVLDTYNNNVEQTYELIPLEKNNPEVIIFEPQSDSANKATIKVQERFFKIKFLSADESYISRVSINNSIINNPINSRTFLVDTLTPIPSNNKIEIKIFDVFGNVTTKTIDIAVQNEAFEDGLNLKKDMLFVIINGSQNQKADSTFIFRLSTLLSKTSNVEIVLIDQSEKRFLERELFFNLSEKFNQGNYRDIVIWFNGDGVEERESSYWFPKTYNATNKQTWFNITFLLSFTETINPTGSAIYITNSIFLPDRIIENRIYQDRPQALFFKHPVNKIDTLSAITYIEKQFMETGRVDWIQLINNLSEHSPEIFKHGWLEGYYKKHNLPAIMFLKE